MLRWDVTIEIENESAQSFPGARVTLGHDTATLHLDRKPSQSEVAAFVEGESSFPDATEELWVDSCLVDGGAVILEGNEMTGGAPDITGALRMKWTLTPTEQRDLPVRQEEKLGNDAPGFRLRGGSASRAIGSVADELLGNNELFARDFDAGTLAAEPAKKVAIVSCMDARIDVHAVVGLGLGDAHVIRNAGGVVTDDVVRSLVLSQHLLGTEEIVVIQHTKCGLHGLKEEEVRAEIARDVGTEPPFTLLGFDDLEDSVRSSIRRLASEPLLPRRSSVRGFVYDVTSGRLEEVHADV